MTACSQPKLKEVGSCPYDNIDVAPWEGAIDFIVRVWLDDVQDMIDTHGGAA